MPPAVIRSLTANGPDPRSDPTKDRPNARPTSPRLRRAGCVRRRRRAHHGATLLTPRYPLLAPSPASVPIRGVRVSPDGRSQTGPTCKLPPAFVRIGVAQRGSAVSPLPSRPANPLARKMPRTAYLRAMVHRAAFFFLPAGVFPRRAPRAPGSAFSFTRSGFRSPVSAFRLRVSGLRLPVSGLPA